MEVTIQATMPVSYTHLDVYKRQVFNLHPAKVFMGDTGSLLLGGVISALALYMKMPLILLIIALVPVSYTHLFRSIIISIR